MNHEETHSLGAILSAARQERGLPLEQVAHETRIRVQRLKEIEADDLSQFSHPSYARMYLTDYARYLGVDLSQIKEYLPEWGVCGTEGYQYLQETPVDSVKGIRRLPSRLRFRTLIAVTASMLLVSVGGFKIWKTMRDIERLNLSRVAQSDKSALVEAPEKNAAIDASEMMTVVVADPKSDISDALDIPETFVPGLSVQPPEFSGADLTTFVPEASAKPTVPDLTSEDQAVLFVGGSSDRIQ